LIKIYRPNVSLQFPNGGKLTPFLEKLKVGDKVHMEGPFGKLRYESGGNAILSLFATIQAERRNSSKRYSSWLAAAASPPAIKSLDRYWPCPIKTSNWH
jgi:Na+-transporting NADH:ubiquinone oxidoreductase subunit NqrF